ncbi:unnamed protein product [Somion occarium]|uniref:Transcription factor BYE1 n=2 Tax=Somion occarium TaxID=3059160 RepID=A0ABP1E523_9APHY
MIAATMSTRAAARARKERTSVSSQHDNPTDKENTKVSGHKPETKSTRAKTKAKAPKVYCTCKKPDDGTPMILCSECKEWYHFNCVDLKESDAEDIRLYICPACHEKTGLHTVMDWEGPEAMEDRQDKPKPSTSGPSPVKVTKGPPKPKRPEPEEEEESASDEGSEDEYIAEQHKTQGKRRARRLSLSSESASSDEDAETHKAPKRMRRASTASKDVRPKKESESPGPSSTRKRRQSTTTHPVPPPKRRKSESTPGEDATRKYCLTKLEEVFTQIFLRYPILPQDETQEGDEITPSKKTEELTPEEKELVEEKAKHFTADLEHCMFELYAEPDKTGKPHAAAKYKERFRMLTFNLSKPDRVILHKRIASSHISPKELSTMSSTDLANEETKQIIKQAEKEALAQTILKKTILPRAKMTHKGIQDIEDINDASSRYREREREEEEEEDRIERERLARLKVQAERAQAQANQGSVPPESPITPTWGGPPSLPMHGMQGQGATGPPSMSARPPVNPLFVPSASDMSTPAVEGELNLADLINIDDELSMEDVSPSLSVPSPPVAPPAISPPSTAISPDSTTSNAPSQSPPSHATGISPFAAKPDSSSRPSFDLHSLWTPRDESQASPAHDEPVAEPAVDPPVEHREEETKSQAALDVGASGKEADDQDFDMFLRQDEEEKEHPIRVDSPQAKRIAFDALPQVWSGKISMPLDSTIPQEVALVARQVGGRTLGGESPLWRTLFPVDHLRIDGRVPVDKSAEYLTQTRLNAAKELIAVALSPASESSSIAFDTLTKHLIAKGRHGLVFPWGSRPKEHHPGRELYIIPLLSTDSVPEYMELLDDLQLPKVRSSNFLIGIWVLNKGKLAPPPKTYTPTLPTPTPAPDSAPVPVSLPSNNTPQIPILPHTTPNSAMSPFQLPTSASTPSQTIPSDALSSEIASLTPEQIQLMLRTLQATSQPQSGQPSQPSPPINIPQVSLQPWASPSSGYPPSYPQGPPPAGYSPPRPPKQYSPSHDSYAEYPHGQYDSFDRGGGRGGGDRGPRHRGGRGRNTRGFERSRDGGWKNRGRGRGGASSPSQDRGRWGGGPPSQQWG